jgi:BA14K-like protein
MARIKKRTIAMNHLPSKALAVALLGATPSWFAGSAGAVPLGAPGLQGAAGAAVQTVQWRGGRGWWGGPAAGLAAGAIIGGAVAASRPWYGYDYAPGYYSYGYDPGYYSYGYNPGYYDYGYVAPGGYAAAPDQSVAYCEQRYRSYDPASGTYLGYDGLRHPCP